MRCKLNGLQPSRALGMIDERTKVGGADNGGQLARGLDVPGTDKYSDYVNAVQKLPDIDHVSLLGWKIYASYTINNRSFVLPLVMECSQSVVDTDVDYSVSF